MVNSYYKVIKVNSVNSTAKLADVTGLNSGTRVLLIQMKGSTIDETNSLAFGDITNIHNAGKYELNTICGLLNDTIYFRKKLLNNYDSGGSIQLVTVPQYADVTIAGVLNGKPWDPVAGTGGVIIVEASGTITINGNINANSLGFGGGPMINYPTPAYDCVWNEDITEYYTSVPPVPSTPPMYHIAGYKGEGIANYILNKEYGRGKQANGGGGGNNHNSGGGGGANYGAGGLGGQRSNEGFFFCHGLNPGKGGLSLSTQGYTVANNRIYFGGGGGNGHENNNVGEPGGNGGGIIILKSDQIIGGGGLISANGSAPYNAANGDPYSAAGDGGSGGGAGGTIIFNMNSFSGTLSVESKGAKGSDAGYGVVDCMGPGGGGGGGVVWLSTASTPVGMTISVQGGANGVVSPNCTTAACRNSPNGATAGSPGTTAFNNQIPDGTEFNCTSVLTSGELNQFAVILKDENALLSWTAESNAGLLNFVVEKSLDGKVFNPIGELPFEKRSEYHFTDILTGDDAGNIFYRLKLLFSDGKFNYSRIVKLNYWEPSEMRIYPNPVRTFMNLQLSMNRAAKLTVGIYDAKGVMVSSREFYLDKGPNKILIPVSRLSAGLYYLKIDNKDWRFSKSFVKSE